MEHLWRVADVCFGSIREQVEPTASPVMSVMARKRMSHRSFGHTCRLPLLAKLAFTP